MQRFNPHSSHAARAVQCWQILVSSAMLRQTITYRALSELMYQKVAAGVLNEILGHIAFYCIDHDLPPLTSIVVNASGIPGGGIPIDLDTIIAQRESVYPPYDWYDIYPPNEAALVDSFRRER
jgi:hypothetical protein